MQSRSAGGHEVQSEVVVKLRGLLWGKRISSSRECSTAGAVAPILRIRDTPIALQSSVSKGSGEAWIQEMDMAQITTETGPADSEAVYRLGQAPG